MCNERVSMSEDSQFGGCPLENGLATVGILRQHSIGKNIIIKRILGFQRCLLFSDSL